MPDISILIKPASGMCNMRCGYCFYHDEMQNRATASYGFMTEETLEQIIKKTIAYADRACTIAYQGGEPTLCGLDFFRKSIEFQRKYNAGHVAVSNAVQTNGLALTEEWAEFFRENHFLVGISLDGIAYTHDFFRKDAGENGTYRKVLETIDLLKKYGVDFNILTVVHAKTAKKIPQIYRFYQEKGFEYLQFIPCLNPLGKEKERYPYTLTPKAYSLFLRTLFDLWYQDLREGRLVHIQQFEEYVRMLQFQPPDLCGMSGVCSCQYVVEADGEVYPCDFYVLDEYKLGNLKEVSLQEVNEKRAEIGFIEQSRLVHEDCRECKYMPVCRGGCRRHRVPKNYFCTAYYEFFDYALERLEKAAAYLR